jgi:hypothetical protein
VPRLARAGSLSASVLAVDHGLIGVDWRPDGSDVRLRANLADTLAGRAPGVGGVLRGMPVTSLPPYALFVALENR